MAFAEGSVFVFHADIKPPGPLYSYPVCLEFLHTRPVPISCMQYDEHRKLEELGMRKAEASQGRQAQLADRIRSGRESYGVPLQGFGGARFSSSSVIGWTVRLAVALTS